MSDSNYSQRMSYINRRYKRDQKKDALKKKRRVGKKEVAAIRDLMGRGYNANKASVILNIGEMLVASFFVGGINADVDSENMVDKEFYTVYGILKR